MIGLLLLLLLLLVLRLRRHDVVGGAGMVVWGRWNRSGLAAGGVEGKRHQMRRRDATRLSAPSGL